MSCSTCGHTLEKFAENERGDLFFLCPRCGTVKMDAFGQHGDRTYVPKLVERCREFSTELTSYPSHVHTPDVVRDWRALGIEESIYPSEAREESKS